MSSEGAPPLHLEQELLEHEYECEVVHLPLRVFLTACA